jgi:hypothetical protein
MNNDPNTTDLCRTQHSSSLFTVFFANRQETHHRLLEYLEAVTQKANTSHRQHIQTLEKGVETAQDQASKAAAVAMIAAMQKNKDILKGVKILEEQPLLLLEDPSTNAENKSKMQLRLNKYETTINAIRYFEKDLEQAQASLLSSSDLEQKTRLQASCADHQKQLTDLRILRTY